ncbi:MAG: S8 family serine peptidase [Actinoplanes sp.]
MTGPRDEFEIRADAGVGARPDAYTGAWLVLLDRDDPETATAALRDGAGVPAPEEVASGEVAEALAAGGSVVLPEIGVAVVPVAPEQREALVRTAAGTPEILLAEPEREVFVFADGLSGDYLRGFQAAANALAAEAGGLALAVPAEFDESLATWGLQAIRATESSLTGRGVRVAVLDTGIDENHRDLVGRTIVAKSFVAGESAADGHGHGTHCIGTACGVRAPKASARYGVAGDAEIYAGKVLSNAGSGRDGGILAGINWAVAERCQVVSMSLGAPTSVGDTFSRVYETVAKRALRKGTVIVAAAGNESRRPGRIAPVGHPANCPSILAVAALAPDLTVAPFSCAGLNPNGGQVDIAAPGVTVRSSYPEPTGYRNLSGTSMATPHVAGVLALLSEQNPSATPAELKTLLAATARRLSLPSADVGAGLVQAP